MVVGSVPRKGTGNVAWRKYENIKGRIKGNLSLKIEECCIKNIRTSSERMRLSYFIFGKTENFIYLVQAGE